MSTLSTKKITKNALGVVAIGALAFGLTACSAPAEEPAAEPDTSSSEETMPEPLASIPDLSNGVDTQVTVDQGFVDAITGLGVTPGIVGGATFTDGVFSFPITGGNVDYYDPAEDYRPYVQGMLEHEGSGLSLTAGTTVVELTDFVIDPGTSELTGTVSVNGEVAAEDVLIFDLYGGTLKPLQMEGTNAVLEGTTVHISDDAAALLNETFMTDGVPEQFLVGVAKITVATE